jgi:diguanylate cyclase (GGDEF)-like protein/PAS domain S-box-containing protein
MHGNESRDDLTLDAETYRLLVERSSDGVAVIQEGLLRYVNPRIEELLGYAATELTGTEFAEHLHPDDRAAVEERYRLRMAGKPVSPIYEIRVRSKSGEYVPIEINAGILPYEGRPADFALVRDIRDRKRTEEALREATRKVEQLHQAAYRLADAASEEEIYRETVHAAEEILSFSKCTLDIVEGNRLVVKATSNGIGPGESQDAPLESETLAAETLRTGETYVFGSLEEVPAARPTHSDFHSGISLPLGRFGIFQVASTEPDAFTREDARLLELLVRHAAEALERLRLHRRLEEQATHDPLTGVYNRRHFTDGIGKELERSRRYEHPLAFLMIDINGFKAINDTFGHQVGDAVLCNVARAIEEELRSVDIVIRYGGDEFLAVLPETDREANATAARLKDAIERRARDEEFSPIPISLAIGVACWSPDGEATLDDVLREADDQMYAAKGRSVVG